MATKQSRKVKPPKVIGAISEFAGVLVGTAVVTGKRIVKTAAHAGEELSSKPRKKAVRVPARKKKKVAKKKSTGPGHKSKGPRKGPAQSPAKKLKAPD